MAKRQQRVSKDNTKNSKKEIKGSTSFEREEKRITQEFNNAISGLSLLL